MDKPTGAKPRHRHPAGGGYRGHGHIASPVNHRNRRL